MTYGDVLLESAGSEVMFGCVTALPCVSTDTEFHLFSKQSQQLGKAAWGIFLQKEGKLSGTVLRNKGINALSLISHTSPGAEVLVFLMVVLAISVSHLVIKISHFPPVISCSHLGSSCEMVICKKDKSIFTEKTVFI